MFLLAFLSTYRENDDTRYVVRNTRGVTGFVGPGSKPVPPTEEEMKPLGIKDDCPR